MSTNQNTDKMSNLASSRYPHSGCKDTYVELYESNIQNHQQKHEHTLFDMMSYSYSEGV